MKLKFTTLITAFVFLAFSCKKDDQGIEPQDYQISQEVIDGISYKCITIGDQVWMAENLKTRLGGGRAEGSMTFNEPIIELATKEPLDMKRLVNAKLINQLNDGLFDLGDSTQIKAKEFIDNGLTRGFFNSNTFGWDQYQNLNADWNWSRNYDSVAVDLVRREVTRLFTVEKELILLSAADQNYLKEHGNLYNFEATKKVVPQGWRIPSDEDWMKLERAFGMSESDVQKIDQWRGSIGNLLKSNGSSDGFNATLGGAFIYGFHEKADNFVNRDIRGYWWTSTKDVTAASDSTYIIRSLRFDNDQMLRGTTRVNSIDISRIDHPAYSIRLVKDK